MIYGLPLTKLSESAHDFFYITLLVDQLEVAAAGVVLCGVGSDRTSNSA